MNQHRVQAMLPILVTGPVKILAYMCSLMIMIMHAGIVLCSDREIAINHLAKDLTILNLANFFEGNNSLLVWDSQSQSDDELQPSLRNPEVATTNSSALTRCKHWADYRSDFGGVSHWIGVCDNNRISRIKFNSFMNTVSLIRSIEYPKYKECKELTVDFGKDVIAAYCLDITNPQKQSWGLSMFNGSTLEELRFLPLGGILPNLTDVKLGFSSENIKESTIILAGNPMALAIIDFDMINLTFMESSKYYFGKNLSSILEGYSVMQVISNSHYIFGLMVMKTDGSQSVELYQFTMDDVYNDMVPLEPVNDQSTIILSKFKQPLGWDIHMRSNMLTIITIVFKDLIRASLSSWSSQSVAILAEYDLKNAQLDQVYHVTMFEPRRYDDHSPEVLIVGLDSEKKTLTSLFCSPQYRAVEQFQLNGPDGFGKNLTLSTIISQRKGIVIDSYELLLVPLDSADKIMIQQVGPPQLFINSLYPNIEADQLPKKRQTLVLAGTIRDANMLTVSTITGFSPDYFSKVSLPDTIEVFADQENEINIPKDKIQINSPQFSVSLTGDISAGLGLAYVTPLRLKFPEIILGKILKTVHLGNDFYLLQNITGFVVIACSQPLQYLRCSRVINWDLPNERILAAIFHQGNFIVLTASNLVKIVRLRILNMEGTLLNNPATEWTDVFVSQGTLRIIDNKIMANLIASKPMADSQSKFSRFENLRFMYSVSFTGVKDIPKHLELDEELPGPLCPTFISWGFSQLKILNVLSYCEDSGHTLVTLDYKTLSMDSIVNRTESLPQKYPVEMCSTGFQMVVFDKNASTIVLHGEGPNGSMPVLNILNYPFQVYGMVELISFHCVLDESFFFVLAKHKNGTFHLLAYRYDLSHNPWDRVHSIQPLSIQDPVEIIGGEVRKREVVVLVLNQTFVEGLKYVLGAPKITLGASSNITSAKLTVQVVSKQSELAARKGIPPEIMEKEITVKYLDQSYWRLENRLESTIKQTISPWDSSVIDIEDLLKIKAPVLGVTLQGVSADVARVVPRVMEINEQSGKSLLGPRILSSNYGILTENTVMVTWNETTISFYKDGVLMTRSKHYKILTVFFARNVTTIERGNPAPVLLIEGLKDGSRNLTMFVNLMLLNKQKKVVSDRWYNMSVNTDAPITRPKGVYQQNNILELPESFVKVFMLSADNKLLYVCEFRIRLDAFWKPYDGPDSDLTIPKGTEKIEPYYAFDRRCGMLEMLYFKRLPVLVTLHQGSNSLRLTIIDGFYTDSFFLDFPVDFLEFSEGSIDCEDTPNMREFICTVVSIKTTKSWFIQINMPVELDPKSPGGVPTLKLIKALENIRGFQAMRAVTTRDYIAIYNKNLEDYIESGGSGDVKYSVESEREIEGLPGSESVAGGLSKSSSRTSKASVLSEQSLITIFSTKKVPGEKSEGNPVAIVPFSTLKSLSPESKLLNWYFDLAELPVGDSDSVETVLLVLARFTDKAVLVHYEIGRAKLEIVRPGKVHSKKGKILLQGVDSLVEVPFHDLFKRNWTRLFVAWTLMALVATAGWFLGLWLLRHHHFKFLAPAEHSDQPVPSAASVLAAGGYGSFGEDIENRAVEEHISTGYF